MTTERDLIQRLVDELQGWIDHLPSELDEQALIDEARAYLAQPEPEGLTDEEILDLSEEHDVSYTSPGGKVINPYQDDVDIRDDVLSFARALIAADRARWSRPAVEPETNSKA